MEMNKYIDHTPLKTDVTYDKIETLCAETKEYDFANVCANNYWVSACAELLKGMDVKICAVTGLPPGVMSTKTKAFEAAAAIAGDAKEIDVILNIGEMKVGHYDTVRTDVRAVTEAAEDNCVKVILKNCLLTKEKIIKACEPCVEVDVALVKTSTGFSTSGATPEGVKLIKDTVRGHCLVKAVGGVRCYGDMGKMVEAGADRIGASVGVKLMQKETSDDGY